MQPMPAIIEKSIAPPIPSVTAEPAKKPAIPASIMIITETVVLSFFHMLLLIFELRFPSRLIFGPKKSHPNRAKQNRRLFR
jgi:hypothetical protein